MAEWPLRCVCSLCDCGLHTCSTLDSLAGATSSPTSDLRQHISNNRCAKMQPSAGDGAAGQECECQAHERYLTSALERQAGQSEQVLRVLVSRPEVAERPRDNIVFEGDMDLRTEFDVSYEALARMRLDQWRKYQEQQQQHSRQEPQTQHTADEQTQVEPEQPEQQRTGERATKEEPQTDWALAESANRIDPQLSPLILYDANMNRLERVGLRKRSKYRPSTSLRAGGLGMFGAADAPTPVCEAAKQTDSSRGERTAKELADLTGAGGARQTGEFYTPPPSPAAQPDPRNLADSFQPDWLTFSPLNIPVGARRKLPDNINLHDHIREQNIVEHCEPTHWVRQSRAGANEQLAPQQQQQQQQQQISAEDANKQHEELLERDEAAALAEIQRATGEWQQPQPDKHQLQHQQERPKSIDHTRRRNQSSSSPNDDHPLQQTPASRQSVLQRTCQQRNFDIFERQYRTHVAATDCVTPTNEVYLAAENAASKVAVASGRPMGARKYNDLFRESPDFLMATGWIHEMQQAGAAAVAAATLGQLAETEASAKQEEGGTGELDANRQDEREQQQLTERPSGDRQGAHACRVFRLAREFDFVGCQCGHKYFVEKHESEY